MREKDGKLIEIRHIVPLIGWCDDDCCSSVVRREGEPETRAMKPALTGDEPNTGDRRKFGHYKYQERHHAYRCSKGNQSS